MSSTNLTTPGMPASALSVRAQNSSPCKAHGCSQVAIAPPFSNKRCQGLRFFIQSNLPVTTLSIEDCKVFGHARDLSNDVSWSWEWMNRPFYELVQMDQINNGPHVTIRFWYKRHRTAPFTNVFDLFDDAKFH